MKEFCLLQFFLVLIFVSLYLIMFIDCTLLKASYTHKGSIFLFEMSFLKGQWLKLVSGVMEILWSEGNIGSCFWCL